MAGINVNQITSTLAGLPDQALQQYAQMHKSDPYIMSLAVSESNRRKQMRAGAQTPQGMQEQPKVADAELAQMAPEEQGIGALPAPNMQGMADGGIAGYDGYDEGDESYGQEPVMMMAEGGVARYNGSQSQFVQDLAGIPAAYEKWWQRNREEDAAKAAKEQAMAQRRQEMMEARQKTSFANYLFGSPEREAEGQAELAQLTKPTGSMPEPGYTRAGMKGDPRLNVPPTQPLQPEQSPAATGKKAPPATGGAPGASRGAAPAPVAGLADLQKQYADILKGQNADDPAGAERKALQEQIVYGAEEAKRSIVADQKKGDDTYKGREERLSKREKELEKSKDTTMGFALLEAGLAMAGTSGRWTEGVKVAGEKFVSRASEGLEKLRAAQERLGDARDRLEDLRLNRDDMNARELRQANSEVNRAKLDAQKMGIDAIMARDGVNRDTATKIFAATMQQADTAMKIEGQKESARISAGPSYQRNQMLAASQGQEAKVRAEYGKLQAKVMDDLSKNQNFIMANPAQQQVMQTSALRQALMNNPFLAPYAAGIGFSAAPAGGKVYDLTED